MATVTFYEKPGCINNTKQKELLSLAGHEVRTVDLIAHPWSESELLRFFDGMEVKDWFNPNAPDVYKGRIHPESFTKETALAALLENHLLIKRPLLIIEGLHIVGFDKQALHRRIGLEECDAPRRAELTQLMQENLSDCPKKSTADTCD